MLLGYRGRTGLRFRPSRRRKLRGWIVAALLLIVVAVVAVAGISAYVGWNLTHPKRVELDDSPSAHGLAYEDVQFPSRVDGISVSGWFLPAQESRKTVIMAHGYAKNRLQSSVPALDLAARLVGAGYNVLLFDFRNSGLSGGDLTSVGQFEVRDLLGAVDFIRSRGSAGERIALLGFSMGAAISLMAAAEEPAVAAVVADSSFSDLKSYLTENLPVWTNLPAFPFNRAFLLVVPVITELNPSQVSPIKAVERLRDKPLLLIHGESDASIPAENSLALWKATGGRKSQIWLVPGADHVQGYRTDSSGYWSRLESFLKESL